MIFVSVNRDVNTFYNKNMRKLLVNRTSFLRFSTTSVLLAVGDFPLMHLFFSVPFL